MRISPGLFGFRTTKIGLTQGVGHSTLSMTSPVKTLKFSLYGRPGRVVTRVSCNGGLVDKTAKAN